MVDLTQTEFSLLRNHSTRIRTYVPKTFWSRLSLFIIHRWHLSFMRKVLYRYVEHVKIFQNALSWWRYCKKVILKHSWDTFTIFYVLFTPTLTFTILFTIRCLSTDKLYDLNSTLKILFYFYISNIIAFHFTTYLNNSD